MNKCNGCGRYRTKVHVCPIVRELKNGKMTTRLLVSSRKSKHVTRPTKKNSTQTLVGRILVTWAIAAASFASFTALANYDNSVTYQAPIESLIQQKIPVHTETIKEKIQRYADKYDVSEEQLENIVKCEAGAKDVNQASTTIRSRYLEGTPRHEKSWGLAQIHVSKVNVTYEQAIDPDFALDYLAKNWKAGNQWMWKNCSLKYGYL